MFKNKCGNSNNICGKKISELRNMQSPQMSQRALAEYVEDLSGLSFDKNAIQRIESGRRFVTDIELKTFAKVFNVTCDYLINEE